MQGPNIDQRQPTAQVGRGMRVDEVGGMSGGQWLAVSPSAKSVEPREEPGEQPAGPGSTSTACLELTLSRSRTAELQQDTPSAKQTQTRSLCSSPDPPTHRPSLAALQLPLHCAAP